jgi:Ca2+-binding EF-hand superfamily protein
MSAIWSEDVVLANVKRLLLAKSGVNAIRHTVHLFRAMDTNADGELSVAEFKAGLAANGVVIPDKDVLYLAKAFDRNNDGKVTVDEFVKVLVGGVNARRRAVMKKTYAALAARCGGAVATDALVAEFDAALHPSVVAGQRKAGEVAAELTGAFAVDRDADGVVSEEEFCAFFTGMSATVPTDEVFEATLLRCFHADAAAAPRLDATVRDWEATGGDPLARPAPTPYSSPLHGRTGQGYSQTQMVKTKYSAAVLFKDRNPSLKKDFTTTTQRAYPPPSSAQVMASFGDQRPPPPSMTGDPVVDRVRALILKRVGADGFNGLSRSFRTFDKNRDQQLSAAELDAGLSRIGVKLSPAELNTVMAHVDRNSDSGVTVGEFCRTVRGAITAQCRLDILQVAFARLDASGNGVIELSELAPRYDTARHPDVVAGKKTPEEVLEEFVGDWDANGDGRIPLAEWLDYYSNISCTIDNDQYFELMIRNAWHISGGTGAAQNTTCRRVLAKFADGREQVLEIQDDIGIRSDDVAAMKAKLLHQGHRGIVSIKLTA